MEGQPSSSPSQEQLLKTKMTNMLSRMDLEMPKIDEQCIYEVPQKFRQVNPKAYAPLVVSIGPFHKPCLSNGENNTLKSMEDVKLQYLERFLKRNKQLSMKDLFLSLIKKERRIRNCYTRPIDCSSNDFLTMILVDACFIIEHFLRIYTGLDLAEGDPLSQSWLLDDIIQDLVLLENQLPFFVLEDIFDSARHSMHVEFPYENIEHLSIGPTRSVEPLSFLNITFYYFRQFNDLGIVPTDIERPKHFTDLLRTFMQPSPFPKNLKPGYRIKHLQSASQLSGAGLEFKVSSKKCLFDIKYHHHEGELEMPCLVVDDDTERLFRNILTFEQCHYQHAPHVSQYVLFLDFLINTDKDVDILIDKKIIVNLMGDANIVAKMFNTLCSNISVEIMSEEYCSLHDDLIKFYDNPYNKYQAIFYHEYFNTPWKKASTIAAGLLLFLTLTQTICSFISIF